MREIIAQIYDNAVANISEDADYPMTPPLYWQKVLPIMEGAPELFEGLQKAITALNTVPSFSIPALETTSYKLLPELERIIRDINQRINEVD